MIFIVITYSTETRAPRVTADGDRLSVTVPERDDPVKEAMDAAQALIRYFYDQFDDRERTV
jgi:hypothetical protein